MATVKKACKKCGNEHDGRLKSCPEVAKTPSESFAKDVGDFKDSQERAAVRAAVIDAYDEFLGSDIVVEGVIDSVPGWRSYGMCDAGYEVFPGWVWSQRKLVCVRGDAPSEVLDMLQDAFQRKCVNRVPVMGDADYGNKEKSS